MRNGSLLIMSLNCSTLKENVPKCSQVTYGKRFIKILQNTKVETDKNTHNNNTEQQVSL